MSSEYPLHKLVFNNNVAGATAFLNSNEGYCLGQIKDHHGNTPLHLAVMLGHKDCVELLLKHGHPVNVKNSSGWSVIQEAVSFGNKPTIFMLYRELSNEKKKEHTNKKPEITKALNSLVGDFYVKMIWDFQSWIPFVSRILPSDECQIYRKGKKIRMDSTLEDFADKHWVRGDLTYIIDFEGEGDAKIILLDNRKKVYIQLQEQQTREEKELSIQESVNISMSNDISDGSIKTSNVSINRMSTGWIFRQNRTETIGRFKADFYKVSGLKLVTRKRREHLSENDIKKNKVLKEALSRGENTEKVLEECGNSDGFQQRHSLSPPSLPKVTWKEYRNSSPNAMPQLGRPRKEKVSQKEFEATLGISPDFPIKLEDLLPILESLGPKAKIFSKLRDFITLHLPPGFPIRIDMPIFPTVKATVSFPEFELRSDMADSLFSIPANYKELPPDYFEKNDIAKKASAST